MKRKTAKKFVDQGFGFPVILINVPLIFVRGTWTPEIDYNELQHLVLKQLAFKLVKLAGHEIRFIRQSFGMTVQTFAKRFCVTHPAVLKWEKQKNKSTLMNWAIEKDIRLSIILYLNEKQQKFLELYKELEKIREAGSKEILVDIEEVALAS